jgi:hypothetical protein
MDDLYLDCKMDDINITTKAVDGVDDDASDLDLDAILS